jgi:prephenate dehydratase
MAGGASEPERDGPPELGRGGPPEPVNGGPRAAFSGEPGAFAEDALLAALDAPRSLPVGGFREVFEAVRDGLAEVGVVPIENVVNGTVREVYDLLLEHDLLIRGEVVVPVRLCLAALPGARLEEIERVYSHIQALGQADAFLRRRSWALLTTYNTAGAGRLIADRSEVGSAAVLSPRAAAHFGLAILADGIENDPANRTRFILVGRPDRPFPAAWRRPLDGPTAARTTLAFAVRNEPGALLAVLRVLAEQRLNLSALESRPSRRVAWEYVFWADIDADLLSSDAATALDAIRPLTTMVRVLGAYQRVALG